MKLEIIEDKKFNTPTWYILRVDGVTIQCSKQLEEIEAFYEHIKQDPKSVIEEKIVLKSEEIDVSLQP